MKKESRVLCLCRGVTEEEIQRAVATGAETLEEVCAATGCCMRCGACAREIQDFIDLLQNRRF